MSFKYAYSLMESHISLGANHIVSIDNQLLRNLLVRKSYFIHEITHSIVNTLYPINRESNKEKSYSLNVKKDSLDDKEYVGQQIYFLSERADKLNNGNQKIFKTKI
jgi:hypothetical protein